MALKIFLRSTPLVLSFESVFHKIFRKISTTHIRLITGLYLVRIFISNLFFFLKMPLLYSYSALRFFLPIVIQKMNVSIFFFASIWVPLNLIFGKKISYNRIIIDNRMKMPTLNIIKFIMCYQIWIIFELS